MSAISQPGQPPYTPWPEDNEKPYYTDKPDSDAFGAMLLVAACHTYDEPVPSTVEKGWNFGEHPLVVRLASDEERVWSLFRGVTWWLPLADAFFFQAPLPTDNQAMIATLGGLRKELEKLNQLAWQADEDAILDWADTEGYPIDGTIGPDGQYSKADIPEHTRYDTHSGPKFAFSMFWRAMRFAEEQQVPNSLSPIIKEDLSGGGDQMSNKVFQQNLDDKKGPQPGGPYLIQMLFKEPVPMPDKEKMTAVMGKHIGVTECFCYDKKMAGFAALDHIAEFKDGKCPVQLMVMKCDKFKGKGFDAFLLSQMWDCQEDRERIFRECRYQVVATDMLAAALPALERANLDADFLEALAELYPSCEAFYFQNCGKLFLAEDVRSHQIEDSDRFIRFGVNVRFFNIEGTEDMLIDTVGMSTLFLPDLQYHFHDMDPNWVGTHAYNVASYILEHDNPIKDGETIDGVANGQMCREIQWKCQYEDALIQPPREVLAINMGKYASGGR